MELRDPTLPERMTLIRRKVSSLHATNTEFGTSQKLSEMVKNGPPGCGDLVQLALQSYLVVSFDIVAGPWAQKRNVTLP